MLVADASQTRTFEAGQPICKAGEAKGAGDATVMSLPLSEALDLKKQPASELGGEFLFCFACCCHLWER